eukprot:1176653-Prorocentrum_minimum.AAC.2
MLTVEGVDVDDRGVNVDGKGGAVLTVKGPMLMVAGSMLMVEEVDVDSRGATESVYRERVPGGDHDEGALLVRGPQHLVRAQLQHLLQHEGPIRCRKRRYILTRDQSDAGSVGTYLLQLLRGDVVDGGHVVRRHHLQRTHPLSASPGVHRRPAMWQSVGREYTSNVRWNIRNAARQMV